MAEPNTYQGGFDTGYALAMKHAADLIRCDCCDCCGESPGYPVCANVQAKRIYLLASGKPHGIEDGQRALNIEINGAM